jgi:hypothetical protein
MQTNTQRDGKDEDPRIGAFLSQCTEGLKDDPELWLQTERELRSHLESKMAEHADEEDPVGAALQAMGSPIEIAGPLQAENTRRMKARALVRLGVRAVLIPAALLMSGWLLWDAASKASVVMKMSGSERLDPLATSLPGLTEDDKLFLYGPRDITDPVERALAMWKRFPSDPVFLSQYLTAASPTSSADSPEFSEAIKSAKELDPENAFYHYIAADVASRKAFTNIEHDENGVRFDIVDNEAAEVFYAELLKATEAKRYHSYRDEYANRRLSILDRYQSESVERRYAQYAAVAWLPVFSSTGSIVKLALGYADLLRSENKLAEAGALTDAIVAVYDHQLKGAENTLIDWVVVMSLTDRVAVELPRISDGLPIKPLTQQRMLEAGQLSAAFRFQLDSNHNVPFFPEISRKGGFMALKAADIGQALIWDPNIKFDLTPGRWLDYILLERLSLVIFLSLLIITSLWCFVRFLWIRWRNTGSLGHHSIPLLLVPGAKEIALVIGVGVVLPLIAYFFYSRWSVVSGRDLNATTQIYRFVTEQIVLWVVMLGTVGMLTQRFVRKRFRQIGIVEQEERALYRATLMRSAAPVLAVVALTCALIAHPYLDAQESRLLNEDKMMQVDPDGGFSRFESKMVDAIRQTMLAARNR